MYKFDAHSLIKASPHQVGRRHAHPQDGNKGDYILDRNFTPKHYNYYVYNYIPLGNARFTVGASYDNIQEKRRHLDVISPKIGIEWAIMPRLLLRLAAFKTVKPTVIASQTIQPTQIAGFNQFYDELNETTSRLYGVGVDTRIDEGLYSGVEISRRSLDSPTDTNSELPFNVADQSEDNYHGYLYMTMDKNWAMGMEIYVNRYNSSNDGDFPLEVSTLRVPLSLLYFDERGLFGSIGITFVNQDVVRSKGTRTVSKAEGNESFGVVDLGVGYRLPQRRGLIGIEAMNILDKKLRFQDDSFRDFGRNEPRGSRYIPERTVFARATLNY